MAERPSSAPSAKSQLVPLDGIVDLLAPALGREKSMLIVVDAAKERGLDSNLLNWDHAVEILTALGTTPGVVGVSARFATTRLVARRRKNSSGPHAGLAAVKAPPEASATGVDASARLELKEIARALAHTMGSEKAEQIVKTAMEELGFSGDRLDRVQVFALLDRLARAQGIVGIASRFAKARMILRFENG